MIVQEYFCDQPSCSKKKITPPIAPSKEITSQTVSIESSDNSEYKQEIDRLKKEVERLLCENSELRKEIARLKGDKPDDACEAGLCILFVVC